MILRKRALLTGLGLLAAATGSAHAQSSVTLYGVIDVGIDYISSQRSSSAANATSGKSIGLQSGNLSPNRWGLRGTEDLGGGLSAVFTLENGFTVNNGAFAQGGDAFGRLAFVGLSSREYGTVTLGRQYDDVVEFVTPFSAAAITFAGQLASHPFDNDGLAHDVRMNNAIMYKSRDYNGLKFGGGYAFSNSTNFRQNRAFTAGASYDRGPFGVGAAFFQVNNPGGLTDSNTSVGAITRNDTGGRFIAQRQRVYAAGAHYDFGKTVVGLVATRTSVDGPTAIADSASTYAALTGNYITFYNYELNARYALTPMLHIGAAYTYTQGHLSSAAGRAVPKWHQVTVQSDYALSKRTDIYLEASYQRLVDGSDSPLATAGIYTFARSTTNHQAVVTAGIRTSF